MKWMAWPSIENSYRAKEIAKWVEHNPGLLDCEYIITEKLHGSNVQVAFSPDGEIRYGSRNQWLANDDAFFGCFPKDIQALTPFTNWTFFAEEMYRIALVIKKQICLCGELFGPGIQKGVDYGPEKRIRWFGYRLDDELQSLDALTDFLDIMEMVPIIDRVNGLQSALDYDTEFSSRFNPLPDNICEGIVICPSYPVRWGDSWFMLKKKNEAFKEKAHAKKEHIPDEVVDPLNLAFMGYITEQRMFNVFSKEGPIESKKDIGRYIKLILADAREDFIKDYPEVEPLDKAQKKGVYNVGSMVAKLLLAEL